MYKCTHRPRFSETTPAGGTGPRRHKNRKTESLYIFRAGSTAPRSVLLSWGSSARAPPVFSVHCWAHGGAATGGRRRPGASEWEERRRWGGRLMAGWTDPPVVHFPGPGRRQKHQIMDFSLMIAQGWRPGHTTTCIQEVRSVSSIHSSIFWTHFIPNKCCGVCGRQSQCT